MAEIAWATGLFEGEGCITMRSGQVGLRLVSTDRDVVERFQEIMGFGKLGRQMPTEGKNKILYHTSIGGLKAEAPLLAMLPYLGNRRWARALEALATIAERNPWIACSVCGTRLRRRYPTQHYCSVACKNAMRREQLREARKVRA